MLHRGTVVRLKRRLVVALLKRSGPHGWECMPLYDPSGTYPPGGYDIMVFTEDLRDGDVVEFKDETGSSD